MISTLTGLVTEEQLPADEVTEKELQRKAQTVLAHALEVEKTMLQIEKEIADIYYKGQGAHIRVGGLC